MSLFPDPVYRETVLAPLFDGVKVHYADTMMAINQAHLLMLRQVDILPADNVKRIAHALHGIINDIDVQALQYTAEHEDYFFLVEAELKTRLGADLGGMLHTARSRNDMDHTMFKMVLRTYTDQLLRQAMDLADTVLNRMSAEKSTYIVAYTHGQPAQPSTFSHYLGAVLEVLLADICRLTEARRALDLCPMGAAAITTTGFSIDRHYVAELLGFCDPKRNSYGCIASVDYITGLYSAIKLLFLHLGRVVQDMAFWSAFEVGQLYVPNALVQISSIMPQKRNPVPIEHMRHLASATTARCDLMVNTMHNTPFTDMNDSEGEVQAAGYAAFDSGGRMLDLLSSFIASVDINQDRVRNNADAACITITELADTLVRDEKLSFRQAHEIAADTAQEVIQSELTLGDGYEAFLAAFSRAMNRDSLLSRESFRTAVSIEHFVSVRNRFGGPASVVIGEAIQCYANSLHVLVVEHAESATRITQAEERRLAAFNALRIN